MFTLQLPDGLMEPGKLEIAGTLHYMTTERPTCTLHIP